MNKFTNLKKWFTVQEAAKRLSNSFGEDISEADVLQQALDGNLKISIKIVDSVKARRTKVITWGEAEWLMFPMSSIHPLPPEMTFGNAKCPPILQALWQRIPEDERGKFTPVLLARKIDGNRFLVIEQQITEISGIYDLPMIGDERLDVEHQYHLLTGGPNVSLQSLGDVFVEDENGVFWQLQVHQSMLAQPTEEKIQLRKLKEHISSKKIKRSEAHRLLAEHVHQYEAEYSKERENESNGKFATINELDAYEPLNTLPEESMLIVSCDELLELERLMMGAPQGDETCMLADIQPKPKGHLSFNPDFQLRANAIAAELKAKSVIKKKPGKEAVAKILAKELGMTTSTVMRRILVKWR